jgi:c-di-GMP-binding flagellar brake protein YcgR
MKFEETGSTSEDLSTAVLFRSHIEITRILRNLARDEAVLTAEFGDPEQLFMTRLLDIDAEGAFFVVAYSQERRANRALLEQSSVVFRANDKRGRIEFTVARPTETVFAGAPAIRFAVPPLLIRSQRREHPRFSVPADVSLRCIADSTGVASFEARIVDVSRGGMGGMVHDSEVMLTPGTVLKDCKIMLAGSDPIIADLEVCYTVSSRLPDGSVARRSGVKFLSVPKGWDALLNRFVIEFGDDR